MEESTCHEMLFVYRRDLVVCYVCCVCVFFFFFFGCFFISFKYDFHVDAEGLIV